MPRLTPSHAPGLDGPAADGALDALRALLGRYVRLTDAEWTRFVPLLRPRRLRRGAHLVRAGARVRTLSFVVAGVLRRYYVVEGREVTTGLLAEHSFATDYPALCAGDASESSLQALTAVALLSVDVAELEWLARGDGSWRDFAPAAGIALARRRERRQVELLTRSPEERYGDLLRQCPTLMDRVPHYHVASYLGITPESLSRLRRRHESRLSGDAFPSR
jgi:CRP-like cAMP-binding protein